MIRIDDNSFMRIVDYMKQFYGLDLTKKRVLVECRLTKVLQNLKIDNFEDYVKVLEKDQSVVLLEQMVDIFPGIFLALIMGIAISLIRLLMLPDIVTLAIQILVGAAIYIGLSAIFKVESFEYLWNMVKSVLNKK